MATPRRLSKKQKAALLLSLFDSGKVHVPQPPNYAPYHPPYHENCRCTLYPTDRVPKARQDDIQAEYEVLNDDSKLLECKE